ncbi:nucleotide pyrophosphohydrolase [Aquabacterium sp. OR-4]|uniref:nucleotide pyrophosphohydrolase n=1 Tax=Aquabacterium sp. OR-4 TaxID=2978127 RepID=UPI0021B49486|nr:nucleotide pyrophosphohydrolase [Aquabacterium sp. OR-4]MDT7833750.1 nucleotide pyrophosphohydrolase [Aquabacterium sp. OR-4]
MTLPTEPSPNPAAAPAGKLPPDSLVALTADLRAFAAARQWQPFHAPKNLAMALSVEAAELLEHFQWLTEAQSRALPEPQRAEVAHEVADVLLYLLQLADQLGIDPVQAARAKMALNAQRFPLPPAGG